MNKLNKIGLVTLSALTILSIGLNQSGAISKFSSIEENQKISEIHSVKLSNIDEIHATKSEPTFGDKYDTNEIHVKEVDPAFEDKYSSDLIYSRKTEPAFGVLSGRRIESDEDLQGVEAVPVNIEETEVELNIEDVAKLVLNGKYGNGLARKEKLESEGYVYKDVQAEVTKIAPVKKIAIPEPKITTAKATTKKATTTKTVVIPAPSTAGEGTKMTVQATAYSMNEPGLSHTTANGTDLRKNPRVIAVDPRVIPLGTMVTVEGYGTYTAADTGGAIKGNKIDIHFNTVQECINFGRRNVNITIHY